MLQGEHERSRCPTTVEQHYNPIVLALATMPKPVIAAVNGVAAGAGASLAFAADFRIVVDTAGFNTSFAGVALSCDTGASWTLPRLVGPRQGDGAALLPAHRRRPPEALELGLATQVVPADELAADRRRAGRTAGRRARRSRSARSARQWRTPPRTRSRTHWPSRREKMALHRRHRGPPGRRRRVRGQGEAGLPRPLSSGRGQASAVRCAPSTPSSCRGACDRHPVPRGVAAVLDGERRPVEAVVEPHRSWCRGTAPPQSSEVARQPQRARQASREAGVLGVGVDAVRAAGGS